MQVSVVIPVFDAADHLREAVESALSQPETREVLLVEDGSRDGSLETCRALAAADERVRLRRHPEGRNRGAAASRQLGLRLATSPVLAFLDADDVYLPGRFTAAAAILEGDPRVDGVYEAVGTLYEDEQVATAWRARFPRLAEMTTMSVEVPPEQLFEARILGRFGYTHLDGLVVRREVVERAGGFDEALRLHQDTALFLKLAAVSRLVPSRLAEPVALRRVHARNRISARRTTLATHRASVLLWESLWRWSLRSGISRSRRLMIGRRLVERCRKLCRDARVPWPHRASEALRFAGLLAKHPELFRAIVGWKWPDVVIEEATASDERMRSSEVSGMSGVSEDRT